MTNVQDLAVKAAHLSQRADLLANYIPSVVPLAVNTVINAAAWTTLVTQAGVIEAGVRYKIRAGAWYSSSGSTGIPRFRMLAPTDTGFMRLVFMAYQTGVAPVVRFDTAWGNSQAAQPNSSGVSFYVTFEVISEFVNAGDIVLQAEKAAGGDSDFTVDDCSFTEVQRFFG